MADGVRKSEPNLPLNKTDVNTFWKQVNKTKNALGQPMFPNLMILRKVILCLPHSSAVAERVFSQLSLTKSPIRNRLTITTCSKNILHLKQSIHRAGSTPKSNVIKNNCDLKSISIRIRLSYYL
jgi:hypothetical protein